jgi:hypothetical protein
VRRQWWLASQVSPESHVSLQLTASPESDLGGLLQTGREKGVG